MSTIAEMDKVHNSTETNSDLAMIQDNQEDGVVEMSPEFLPSCLEWIIMDSVIKRKHNEVSKFSQSYFV